jgi:hypothetical protein
MPGSSRTAACGRALVVWPQRLVCRRAISSFTSNLRRFNFHGSELRVACPNNAERFRKHAPSPQSAAYSIRLRPPRTACNRACCGVCVPSPISSNLACRAWVKTKNPNTPGGEARKRRKNGTKENGDNGNWQKPDHDLPSEDRSICSTPNTRWLYSGGSNSEFKR